jgi:predicted phosphate transport protein (TIGR00153 family)
MAFQILPAEPKFYDWFEKGGANLLETARLFKDLVDEFERPESKIVHITEAERKGDFVQHEIDDLLHVTLITPFDQEETSALAHAIDDVVDIIEEAAVLMILYKIERPTEEAHGLAQLIFSCAEEVDTALHLLRDKKQLSKIQRHVVEINRMEREADALHRRALENLITSSRDDWFEFMRWKEIYEKMEDATDLCEDIADVLQTIVLKHG